MLYTGNWVPAYCEDTEDYVYLKVVGGYAEPCPNCGWIHRVLL